MPLQPRRTVDDLQQLRELTGDENGAQRVAWTDTWEEARNFLRERMTPIGAEEEIDEAGNNWVTLPGASDRALIIGGHLDSVPNGGWLDGCLNVLAGRRSAAAHRRGGHAAVDRPPRRLGRRGGRPLRPQPLRLARRGRLAARPDEVRELKDRDGVALPDALAEHGVDLDRALEARRELENAAAYLELHIEQGPVLETLDLAIGVVLGTFGVERSRFTSPARRRTPGRRRWPSAAMRSRARRRSRSTIREIAAEVGNGGVCTSGGVVTKPGIVTAVVGRPSISLDQRHLDAGLAGADARRWRSTARERIAAEENIEVEWERIWSIEPIPFDQTLIEPGRRSGTRGARHVAPPPIGPAARRRRSLARGHPDGDALRPEPPRHVAQQDRGHEGRAPRAERAGARPAHDEDAGLAGRVAAA